MEFLALYLITTWLFIHGFHAVTREGKLLQFLSINLQEIKDLADIENLANENLLQHVSEFCQDVETKDIHPQATEQDIARATTKFVAICREIKHKDDEYQKIEKQLHRKLSTKKWKFLLAIAPTWSECKLCMSSFWGFFWGGVFAILFYTELSPLVLMPMAPLYLAGATSILETLSNSNELKDIGQSLKEIADGQ